MNSLQLDPPCSICRRTIEGTIYPLAHKEFLCQSCFELCGFSVTTPTNCLAKTDIEDLLGLKKITIEDAVTARDVWENSIINDDVSHGDDVSPVDDVSPGDENSGLAEYKIDSTTVFSVLPEYEELAKDKPIPEYIAPLYPQKSESPVEFPSINSDSLNIRTPQNNDLTDSKSSDNHKISAKTFFDTSSDKLEEEEDTESNRKNTRIKIAVIIVVSLVTIFMVTSFLPDGIFSRNKAGSETISIIHGEKNEYAKKPIIEKDGYIYVLPEGTYKVTMSKESTTPQGMVIVESDKVAPTQDGKGHYENVSTIDLAIGESETITIKENQHIYTSIKSIMEFEKEA